MSAPESPVSPGSESPQQRDSRELLSDVLLALLVRYGRLGRWLRVRRSNKRRVARGVAQGELIVAFTNDEDARSRAIAAVNLALARSERLGKVRFIPVRTPAGDAPRKTREHWRWTEATPAEEEWNVRRGLTRSYVGVATPPGLENVVKRAIEVAAWRFRLPASRRGLVVIHSPVVVAAPSFVPRGAIKFSDEYKAAKKVVGADNIDATGVTIMIIDPDIPDLQELERLDPDIAAHVTIQGPHGPIQAGHGTLMTAIVGDIARNADIIAVSMREPTVETDGFFTLLGLLQAELADVDLIVASVTFGDAPGTWAEIGRNQSLVDAFSSRRYRPRRPPALFPTGNLDDGVDVKCIGVPARLAATVGIGCADVTSDGHVRRSEGSRYGEKDGDQPSEWWLAPGGGFRRVGDVDPFVTVNGEPQAGTSIANAFAGGLLAGAVRRLRQTRSASTAALRANVRRIDETLAATPDTEQSRVIFDTMGGAFTGTITLDGLITECAALTSKTIDDYLPFEHGDGLLCFQ
jgi:hypothetical protein